jgi:uncharacterized protein (TIGR02145 family)
MKKILLSLLTILLFTACQKQISTEKIPEELANTSENKKPEKIQICHYDPVTGVSKTITIPVNAWAEHQAHGDVQGECSTVIINVCEQEWMAKNLDVSTYRNGDPIPQVTDPNEWASLTTGAWCWYENSSANGTAYGKLYNWYAVNDSRGLAPQGWHVPTNDEWTTLANCLGGVLIAGGKMKTTGTFEAGTGLWYSPNTEATNSSGFSGLPTGFRFGNFTGSFGVFTFIGQFGYWWTNSEINTNQVLLRNLSYSAGSLRTFDARKTWGFAVRCVRD